MKHRIQPLPDRDAQAGLDALAIGQRLDAVFHGEETGDQSAACINALSR